MSDWLNEVRRIDLLIAATTQQKSAALQCSAEIRPMVLGNLGYSMFLAADRMAAEAPKLECLQLGGQKLLDAQLEDAKLHRIEPEDNQYEELLNKLWQSLPPAVTKS